MCTYCMRRKSRRQPVQVQRPTTQIVRTRLYTRRAPRPASARRTLGFLLKVLVFLSKSQPAVFTVAGFFFFFRYPKADAHTTTPGEMGALAKGLLRQGSVIGAQLSRRMDWRADVDAGLPRLVAGTLARLLLPVARHAARHALLFQTAKLHLTGLPSAPESKRPLWLEALVCVPSVVLFERSRVQDQLIVQRARRVAAARPATRYARAQRVSRRRTPRKHACALILLQSHRDCECVWPPRTAATARAVTARAGDTVATAPALPLQRRWRCSREQSNADTARSALF